MILYVQGVSLIQPSYKSQEISRLNLNIITRGPYTLIFRLER